MNNKKILAGAMALALVATCFSPMVAKADTIDSGAVYVNTSIYRVTLPTTSAQKFYLDPQGLASGTDAGSGWAAGTGGAIITDATGMTAVNSSSMDVWLETTIKLVSSQSGDPLADDCAIGATDAVTTQAVTTPEVFMEATFADAKASNGAAATLDGALSSGKAVISAAGATYDTKLPAATYTFKLKDGATEGSKDSNDYEYVMTADTESGVNIKLSGACSKTADWSDFVGEDATKSVALDVVYKFFKDKNSAKDTEEIATADVVVSGSTASVTWNRTSALKVEVATSLIPNMSVADFGINYNGSIFCYNGKFTGNDTTLKDSPSAFASLSGNTIILNPSLASYLPAGESLFIIDGSGNVVSTVTVN